MGKNDKEENPGSSGLNQQVPVHPHPPQDRREDPEQRLQDEAPVSQQLQPPRLASQEYQKHAGNIPSLVWSEITQAFANIDINKATPAQLIQVKDYMQTVARLERDKQKVKNSLSLVDNSLRNLPAPVSTTIKLNELVIKPETFNGEEPLPRKWIQEYNECIIANGWSDLIAIKYLPTFLKGPAKDWFYVEIKPYIRSETRWEQVLQAFHENYLSEADYEQLRQAIEDSRQRKGELAANFIPRMRRLMLLLTPNMPEEDQLRLLKNKMRPEYKQLISFSNPTSIKELKVACLRIEAGLIDRNQQKKPTGDPEPRKPVRQQSGPRLRDRKHPGPYGQRMGNRAPARGGFVRRQTNPKTFGSTTVGPSSSPRSEKKDVICYSCNQTGHYSNECPRGRNSQERASNSNKSQSRKPVNLVHADEPQEVLTIRHDKDRKSVAKPKYAVTEIPPTTNLNLVVGGGKLLQQKLICNDVEISAVVDTGAYVTVIDQSIVDHFKWPIEPSQVALIGADGKSLKSKGSIWIQIEMSIKNVSKTKMHRVAVVQNLTAPMLLGLELMRKFAVCIDLTRNELRFMNTNKSGIRTKSDELIPARTQTVVQANINLVGDILVAPFINQEGLMIANSIARTTSNSIPVAIVNPTGRDIKLRKGAQLASAERLQEVETPDSNDLNSNSHAINQLISLDQIDDDLVFGDELTAEQVSELKSLICEHIEAFSLQGELGKCNAYTHKIELLSDAEPVVEPLRRRALVQVQETRRQVKKLLDDGIIEESSSPWASAYVLARKKNGEFRLCIDFRRLNAVTKKLVYPLPNVDECLETLSGKHFFTQLDFKAGFWQIELDECARELTAFRTEDGLYHFKRMPFGLTNAPATFQRMVNSVLGGLKGMDLQVFIDDICIATKNWSEHLAMLAKTFEAVKRANLKINVSKCVFAAKSVKFLGHVISKEGIKQDPDKLKAMRSLPEPRDAKEVKRALGLFSYYRRFVHKFSQLSAPLTNLTKKSVPFKWEDEEKNAFRSIIRELEKNATLSHFNHTDRLRVKTDASRSGVAGILLQQQGEDWKVITCCSRRLTTSEQNYGITDLEGLAVIYTVTKLRPYLLGKQFQILVDHCALCVLNKRTPNSARLRRWAIVLSEFDFEIVYTKGTLHCDIDCLSRAPVDDVTDGFLDDKVYLVSPANPSQWINSYIDEESQLIMAKAMKAEDDLKIIDNLIYKNGLLFVPQGMRAHIIDYVHKTPMNAHPGVTASLSKLKENYWWPNMQTAVANAIAQCEQCARSKHQRLRPAGLMHSFKIYQPGDQVAIDLIENIKESLNGNSFIIVAVDMFSRFVDTRAVPDKGAPTFTQYLIEYCGRYGVPNSFLTDHSTTFCNAFTAQIIKAFGAHHVKATPYHSQGNSIVERVNQTLVEKLRLVLNDPEQEGNWDAALPIATLAINTAYHASLGCTPYELTFGKKAPLQDKNLTIKSKPHDLYGRLVQKYISECHANAVAIQSCAKERSKEFYDKRRRELLFEIGDRVLVQAPSRSSKLAARYEGYYKIIQKDRDIYTLRHEKNRKTIQRHVSNLRPAPIGQEPEEEQQNQPN